MEKKACEAPLHAHFTLSFLACASVFDVLAPPLLGSAGAGHRAVWGEVWMVHCVGWALTAASLPVLVITFPVFPTAASKAGGPPADTLRWWQSEGQCKHLSSFGQVLLNDLFSLRGNFQISGHQSWLAYVVLVQWPVLIVVMQTSEQKLET